MSVCKKKIIESMREGGTSQEALELVDEYFEIRKMDEKGMLLDPEEQEVLQEVAEIADMSELSGRWGEAMVGMQPELVSEVNYNEPRYKNKRVTVLDGKRNAKGRAEVLVKMGNKHYWVDKTEVELKKSWDEVLANSPEEDMQGNFEVLINESKINSLEEMNKAFDEVVRLDKQELDNVEITRLKRVLNKVVGAGLRVIPEMNLYIDSQAENTGGFIETSGERMGVYLKINAEKPRTHSEMSVAETFVHEVVHASTEFAVQMGSKHLGRLRKLRSEAMKVLTVEDMMPEVVMDREAEIKIAKARLEYINGNISEFMAYAVTNKRVMDKLAKIKVYEKDKPKKWTEVAMYYLKKVIDNASMVWRRETRGTNGLDVALSTVIQLAKAQDKMNTKVRKGVLEKFGETIDDLEASWSEGQKKRLGRLAEKYMNEPLDFNKSKLVRARQYAKLMVRAFASEHKTGVVSSLLSDMGMRPEGIVSSTIDTMRESDELKNVAQELALQAVQVDENREATAGKIAGLINSGFKRKLKKKEKAALQAGMQTVDAKNLGGTIEEITEWYKSNEKIDETLRESYGKIDESKKKFYKRQIDGLVELMMTGRGNEIQLKNAEAIVRELGTEDANVSEELDEDMVKLVDKIVGLEAIKRLDKKTREAVVKLLDEEKSGVQNFLELHKAIDDNRRSGLNTRDRFNEKKGYVRETYDKYVHATTAPMTEAKELKAKGYKLVRKIDKGALDISVGELGVFVSKDNVRQPFNRQAIRFTGERSDGLSYYDMAVRSNDPRGWRAAVESTKNTASITRRAMRMVKEGKDVNVEGKVTPEFDEKGRIVDYRYNVTVEDKVELMGLEMDGTTAVGRTVAHQVDIEESEKLNEIVFEELMVDIAKNKGSSKRNKNMYTYVSIDVNSDNDYIRDIARIMPKGFKEKLKELRKELPEDGLVSERTAKSMIGKGWDRLNEVEKIKFRARLAEGKLYVRQDLLLPLFGVRDASIVEAYGVKNLPVVVKEFVRKIENLWKEFVSLYKVGVILKTVPVLVGNLVSNFISGVLAGGNPVDVMKDTMQAWNELDEYKKYQEELIEAKAMYAKTKDEKYMRVADRVENDIKSMEIYPLIKYGLYTQILEETERDTTSSNRIVDFFDRKLESMPSMIQDGVQWMYMTDKTKLFQAMQTITAKSDFIARFAQYKAVMKTKSRQFEQKNDRKMLNNEKERLEKELLREIRDSYVNYTRPDSRWLQYMNDMGLVLFTKYVLRMQRIIMNLASGHPIRAAAALAGQEVMAMSFGVNPSDAMENSLLVKDNMFYSPDTMKMLDKVLTPHLYGMYKSI